MERADVVNKALREDVEKLTVDWSRARDELMRKESQWQMEQEVGRTGWDCERSDVHSGHCPRQCWKRLTSGLGSLLKSLTILPRTDSFALLRPF
jgi:hypothetical protein